ncbi:PAS fold protein [Caballeronia arationis]|uniref:PAS domain-containing protein n=1 Tax=Caballeronia arationis TaxID=1777142 RepID=UPI00074CA8D6|nr:PAS domain-containing protein [Caballeronia arationis]SAL03936.1 PAS fold protein [Caballeronia arationis]
MEYADVTKRHRAEQALLESQSYLKLLLDSTVQGFYAVDREGITTMCNASFVRMLGIASEPKVIGRKLHDVIHHSHTDGTHYDVVDCPINIGAKFGTPAHIENEYFFSVKGRVSRLNIQWFGLSERRAAGRDLYILGHQRTQRVEEELCLLIETLELQIAARTQERDRIWSQSGDLLAVRNLSTGKWLSANPAWFKVLG